MIHISGSGQQYIATSAVQVADTAGVYVQVIAPAANTGGIYVSHVFASNGGATAEWRAHTSMPATSADGVEFGRVGPGGGMPVRMDVGVIIPAGQGIYLKSGTAYSSIFYQVL